MEWLWIYVGAGILGLFILLFLYKLWINSPSTDLTRDFTDKIVIVTGSSAGIGKVTAEELLKKGATVVFACRNEAKTMKVIKGMSNSNLWSNKAIFIQLDLSSYDSIKLFSQEFKTKFDRLDLLINNAGGVNMNFELTRLNIEKTMQTNHISVVLLITLLFDILQKSSGRVINLGSSSHLSADISLLQDYEDSLSSEIHDNLQKKYDSVGFNFYALSKLGTIITSRFFTRYAEQLIHSDINIKPLIMVTVHPGAVASDIAKPEEKPLFVRCILYSIYIPLTSLFLKSEYSGAQTTLHLSYMKDEDIINGGYYYNCKSQSYNLKADKEEVIQRFMNYTFTAIRKHTELDFNEKLVLGSE